MKIIFSVFFMPHNKYFIDQASLVKVAGYWPSSLFAFLMDPGFISVHKNTKTKRELGQYPATLALHLVENKYIYILTHKISIIQLNQQISMT